MSDEKRPGERRPRGRSPGWPPPGARSRTPLEGREPAPTRGGSESPDGGLAGPVLLSASLHELGPAFDLPPWLVRMPLPPSAVRLLQWQWIEPYAAILHFGGWTIDDVVNSPEVRREVRRLWKLAKESRRIAAERKKESLRKERAWMRRQGCPVPCPRCGATEACDCEKESGFA